jgi:hypothetical protein
LSAESEFTTLTKTNRAYGRNIIVENGAEVASYGYRYGVEGYGVS